MASFMAKGAANQVFGDIEKEWSNVMGSVTKKAESSPSTPPEEQIDWADLNYPPYLRVFHYKTSELPSKVAWIVRPIHWLFLFHILINLVNFGDSIALVVGKVTWYRLTFSILQLLITIPVCGYVFFSGYVAVATSKSKKIWWYLLYQGVVSIMAIVFGIWPFGAFNGLSSIGYRNKAEFDNVGAGTKTFWLICSIYESALWFVAALWGAFNMWRAKTFNPYHSEQATA